MRKVLQINVTLNWGSTGKIAEQIGNLVQAKAWNSIIAYGRYSNPSTSFAIKIGNQFDVYEHYFENLFFDNEGLASRHATKRLVQKIKMINPDIIHLHNIHDHYLNYPILFKSLAKLNKPVVWTQHDCWAFTGGCPYYSMSKCDKWLSGCENCPLRISKIDRRNIHYHLRKSLFANISNLTLVPVSKWLEGELHKSFLKDCAVVPIYNGIDINVFRPTSDSEVRSHYNIGNRQYVIAVASVWDPRKNLKDYIKLAEISHSLTIVLVGLTEKQSQNLPDNIIAIPRTQNAHDLAALYSGAFAVLNLSLEETFGLTTAEGMACGTPAIVYDCTASPELVTSNTGCVVREGDVIGLANTIKWLQKNPLFSVDCRKRAEDFFDKEKCFEKYIELYESLLL